MRRSSNVPRAVPSAPSPLPDLVAPIAPASMPRSAQTTGILLLLGSIFLFTLMDATGKHLTARYHPAQIVWTRLAVNLVVVLLIFGPRLRHVIRSQSPGLQIGRGLTQLGSIGCFFAAIQFIGLAEATAIMDINPVLITLGAAVFLGEKIGIRRIAGITVALIGALIVIRPGAGVLHPAAILPLIGAFSYAGGAIMTRMVRGDSIVTSILWSTAVATLGASLVAPFFWQPVQMSDLWAFVAMGLFGTGAQALLIRAFSLAEAGAIAPFGYTGLIWAGLWGWLFFGAVPDLWTVVGATIIVAAGLYVWGREAQAARGTAATPKTGTETGRMAEASD